MKKETLYKVTISVLIVLNLLQVVARFMAHKPLGDPIKMPVKQLALDEVQEKKFRELVQAHRKKMVDFRTEQTPITEAYFNLPSDSLLNEVTAIEKKKIEATQQHFIDVKNMLHANQKGKFEVFKKRSIKRILGFPPPNQTSRNSP